MSVFIPQSSLPHLKEYKYQSEDRSVLTKYVLKPFWLKFVNVFPLSMAPNMVTLSGLLFIVVADLLSLWYDPTYEAALPRWLYLLHGLSVFLYQTFDACDGIHARRTGQSSPLGELFDHCCDSMNTTLMTIQFASVSGMGNGWLIFLTQFSALCNFYLSTWEEYHTHKLFLAEISGPVEGLLMISGVFILTALFGPDFVWKLELFTIPTTDFVITSTYLSAFAGMIVMGVSIYSARRNVIETLQNEHREKELPGAQRGLIPFFGYYATVFALLYIHPIIIQNYTTSMILTIGATMSFCVGRIITGHLTKQSFPFYNLPMILPTIQLIALWYLTNISNWNYDESIQCVIWSGFSGSVVFYFVFIADIIHGITNYLDIWALTIKHPKTE